MPPSDGWKLLQRYRQSTRVVAVVVVFVYHHHHHYHYPTISEDGEDDSWVVVGECRLVLLCPDTSTYTLSLS